MFNHKVCATEARRSSSVSDAGKTSTQVNTPSAASVKIETGADSLDWLNKGIFISVGGRQPGGVIYEVYLVG